MIWKNGGNEMRLSQHNTILKAMLENKNKRTWEATDFQSGKYFVGYEASARMSELVKMYPGLFIVGRKDRFRTLEINWEYEDLDLIKKIVE